MNKQKRKKLERSYTSTCDVKKMNKHDRAFFKQWEERVYSNAIYYVHYGNVKSMSGKAQAIVKVTELRMEQVLARKYAQREIRDLYDAMLYYCVHLINKRLDDGEFNIEPERLKEREFMRWYRKQG